MNVGFGYGCLPSGLVSAVVTTRLGAPLAALYREQYARLRNLVATLLRRSEIVDAEELLCTMDGLRTQCLCRRTGEGRTKAVPAAEMISIYRWRANRP